MLIGLNGSTANESWNDTTLGRCIGFAMREGFGGLYMLNAFGFRTSHPSVLKKAEDPIGPENDRYLVEYFSKDNVGKVVACWGNDGAFMDRDKKVTAMLGELWCFGLTKKNQPKHPLYLRADTSIVPFK